MSRAVFCVAMACLLAGCRGGSLDAETDAGLQTLVDRLAADAADGPTPPEARAAYDRLSAVGVTAFPVLIRNLDDGRPAWGAFQEQISVRSTVGSTCLMIISTQVERYSHAKIGPYFFTAHEPRQWWASRRGKTLRELQIEALEWTIAQISADPDGYGPDAGRRLADMKKSLAQLRREGGRG